MMPLEFSFALGNAEISESRHLHTLFSLIMKIKEIVEKKRDSEQKKNV